MLHHADAVVRPLAEDLEPRLSLVKLDMHLAPLVVAAPTPGILFESTNISMKVAPGLECVVFGIAGDIELGVVHQACRNLSGLAAEEMEL